MKTKLLLIAFLLPFKLFCQTLQPEVYLFTKDEALSMKKFLYNEPMTKKDSAACSKLVDNPNGIKFGMLSDKAMYNITGLSNDLLVIVFRDIATNQIVPVANGNLNSVVIKNESGVEIYTSNTNGTENCLIIPLSEVENFPQGYSINYISMRYNGSQHPVNFYFRFLCRFSSYGNIVKNSPVGFWFPVGQFGTNFKKTPQGIIFNAIPIGVAVGTKINFNSKFYIGLSWSFDYTITKASDTTTNSYSFNSFSHGPIIDFGDYIHFGYNWYTNLTTDKVYNREPFFVVGIGIKVLELLKNKQSK